MFLSQPAWRENRFEQEGTVQSTGSKTRDKKIEDKNIKRTAHGVCLLRRTTADYGGRHTECACYGGLLQVAPITTGVLGAVP